MPWTAWVTVDALLVLLALLAILSLTLVFSAIRRGGRREDPVEDDAVATSRFTLPVSLIVPQDPVSGGLSETVVSLLALNYPEFEVIVVADQPHDTHLQSLEREWELRPKEYFYRRSVATSAVHRIFESRLDERLMLVHKEAAGHADALNCGLSLARFRYVACVAPDVVLDPNALLRLMLPALRDPANVLAATSHVERSAGSARTAARGGLAGGLWKRTATDWQRINSVRSWLASCMTVDRSRGGAVPLERVTVWRRDALLENGGFATDAADPEFDMLLRLQATDARVAGEVIRTAEILGRVAPVALGTAGRLRSQRQRAVIEALRTLRRGQRPSSGRVATLAFLAAELITPVAQLCIVLTVAAGAAAGWFPWMNLVLLLVMLSFGNAAITAAALLMRGAVAGAPEFAELSRLLLLAPAEYVIYRPAVAVSRLRRTPASTYD